MEHYVANYLNNLEEVALGNSSSIHLIEQRFDWHYAQARKYLEDAFLKETGAFFTSESTSHDIADRIEPYVTRKSIIMDPACGAGDLLLACARRLPVGTSLSATLKIWGNKIAGFDTNESFIRAAKARLVILARELTEDESPLNNTLESLFPMLKVENGLTVNISTFKNLIIIMNPPFNKMISLPSFRWAEGSITSASAFLYKYINECQDGTHFIAILPEVLRSGTNYSKWRKFITDNTNELKKKLLGRFSSCANVDVFILEGEVRQNSGEVNFMWWDKSLHTEDLKIGDLFYVNVGSVVPHRDEEVGSIRPYIYTRTVKPWETLYTPDTFRKYKGRLFMPPFVVLRRTSAPKDTPRCVASIVRYTEEVAVENHFIVLTPKNKYSDLCDKVVSILKSSRTTAWINNRIKCRHLTVSSISELPWWRED